MKSPIIFVHGIGASASVWKRFDVVDHEAFYISFSDRFANPAEQATELTERINEVIAQTGANKAVLVCHSLGGLTARQYLADYPDDHRVEKLVLLSTPNLGVPFFFGAPFLSPAARAMRPNSDFLRKLNEKRLPVDIEYIVILSDCTAWPQRLLNLIFFREGGDGAVPLSSQKLSPKCIPNFSELKYTELKINLPHFEIPKRVDQFLLPALEE